MIRGVTNPKEGESNDFAAALGTVEGISERGYVVRIDGEDGPREKPFRANASYRFFAGERVKLSKISGTYVVEYPVRTPDLGNSVGLSYSKLSNATVTWVRDPGGADVTYNGTADSAVALRTARKIDFSDIKKLYCKIRLTSIGSGPLYIGLAPTALVPPLSNPTYTYFEKYITLSNTGGKYLELDVSDIEGEYYPTICGAAHAYNFRGFFID